MSILVEFTISSDRFGLAACVERLGVATAELDRTVPTERGAVSYVWAEMESPPPRSDEIDLDEPTVSVTALDTLEGSGNVSHRTLYRIEWIPDDRDVARGIFEAEGEILEASGVSGCWFVRSRLPTHENAARLYEFLATNHGTGFTIERISELADSSGRDETLSLTPEQREAFVLAVRRGYFAVPREVDLAELAGELDITQQAFSQRLRRAIRTVVYDALDVPVDRRR